MGYHTEDRFAAAVEAQAEVWEESMNDLDEPGEYEGRDAYRARMLRIADAADRLLDEYDRMTSGAGARVSERMPKDGRYAMPLGGGRVALVEVSDPTFGDWEPGTKMFSVYSSAGFEDSYGRVHERRSFAVVKPGGVYLVFKKVKELIANGGNGPEALPLRNAVDAARTMVTEGKWLEYAKHFGKATGVCGVCHRRLRKAESVAAGIGPVCATQV